MPNIVEFSVAAVSDKQLLAMVRAYTAATGQVFTSTSKILIWGDVTVPMVMTPDQATKAGLILEGSDSRLIKQINLDFATTTMLFHQKKAGSAILDIQLAPKADNQPSDVEFTRYLDHAKREFHELAPGIAFQNILGEEANQHYAAREATILKLDAITQELFRKTAEVELNARAKIEREQTRLENQFREKEKKLSDDVATRERQIEERAAALDAKEKTLALQASRIERRGTITTLISQLDHQNAQFKLEVTPGTTEKRRQVFRWTVALLSVLFALAVFLNIAEYRDPSSSLLMRLRASVSTAAFLIGSVFFVRWMNAWADRHASEEFRLKRLLLDVRRTNLLIEAALEWETETQDKMPDQILNTLSRNLFADGSVTAETIQPMESFVSLLTHSNATLELKLPATELKAKGPSEVKV